MKFGLSIALMAVTSAVHATPLQPPTRQTAPILGADLEGSHDKHNLAARHDAVDITTTHLDNLNTSALNKIHHGGTAARASQEPLYDPNDLLPIEKLHPIQHNCAVNYRTEGFQSWKKKNVNPLHVQDIANMTVGDFCERRPEKLLSWWGRQIRKCSRRQCRKLKVNCDQIYSYWMLSTCLSKLILPSLCNADTYFTLVKKERSLFWDRGKLTSN